MKQFIKEIVELFGYTLSKSRKGEVKYQNQISKDNFFDIYFGKVNPANFFFVQIGANDGKTNDPMFPYVTRYNLRGISVEVQPDVFLLLKETYQEFSNVQCVNAAIANETGETTFFSVKDSAITKENYSRMTGIATFNKDVLRHTIKNKLPVGVDVDDYIQDTQVQTYTLDAFFIKYNVQKIDMIQIDCEGYDYEIIKMIDFKKFSPSIINFESNHLSNADRQNCEKLLESHGYKWFRHGIDTCAYKV